MTTLTPYLLFDGRCHNAMKFYKSCFSGELMATRVKDSPAKDRESGRRFGRLIRSRLSE
jgi:PhnB protein